MAVVIVAGGNDLPKSKKKQCPVDDMAKYIIDTGKLCESHGDEIIVISGLIRRRNGYMEKRRVNINNMLKECWRMDSFILIIIIFQEKTKFT